MLSVTLKSALKLLILNATDIEVLVFCKDSQDNDYEFKINNESYVAVQNRVVNLTISGKQERVSKIITDIEAECLPILGVYRMETHKKVSNKPFRDVINHIQSDVHFFVTVCQTIKGRVLFRVKHQEQILDLLYLDARICHVEETDESLNVRMTNLYSLEKLLPGYQVMYVESLPMNVTMRTCLERYEREAQIVGKKIVKVKDPISSL